MHFLQIQLGTSNVLNVVRDAFILEVKSPYIHAHSGHLWEV